MTQPTTTSPAFITQSDKPIVLATKLVKPTRHRRASAEKRQDATPQKKSTRRQSASR